MLDFRFSHLSLIADNLQANLLLPILAALVVATFFGTQNEITVTVDHKSMVIKTHLDNVGAILSDAGVTVYPGDLVFPPTNSSLGSNKSIAIKRSRPIVLRADGITYNFRTQGKSVGEVVEESGLELRKEDAVYVGDRLVARESDLPAPTADSDSQNRLVLEKDQPRLATPSSDGSLLESSHNSPGDVSPLEITVNRAVPIIVHDGETHGEIYTTSHVLGDALASQGIKIYEGDLVFPRLGTDVTANMHVYILRAKPITIQVDGRNIQARTQAKTIQEAITQEGVKLVGKDKIEPPREALVESNMVVKVTRVKEDLIANQEPIDFSVEYVPDPTIEIDERRVNQEGRPGLRKWETLVVYENGEEVSRTVVKEWVEIPPVSKVVGYGTNIVLRQLDTPQGPVTYWRKFHMLATSYNASHGGKSRDNPAYGITKTGIRVTHGIVAVDPNVIPLYTQLYVPGYGIALAADTGGAVKGMIIDLGFEEYETNQWSAHYVDVYILAPVPPEDQIQYRMLDR